MRFKKCSEDCTHEYHCRKCGEGFIGMDKVVSHCKRVCYKKNVS